jgi:hypothetical protein
MLPFTNKNNFSRSEVKPSFIIETTTTTKSTTRVFLPTFSESNSVAFNDVEELNKLNSSETENFEQNDNDTTYYSSDELLTSRYNP